MCQEPCWHCPPTSLAGAGTEEHPPSSLCTAAWEIWGCRSAVYRLHAPGADELVGAGHRGGEQLVVGTSILPPERYRSLQGLFFEVPAVMQGLWRATGAGKSIVEVCFLDLGWGFPVNPNTLSPQEAFLQGLSTTGRLTPWLGKAKGCPC